MDFDDVTANGDAPVQEFPSWIGRETEDDNIAALSEARFRLDRETSGMGLSGEPTFHLLEDVCVVE